METEKVMSALEKISSSLGVAVSAANEAYLRQAAINGVCCIVTLIFFFFLILWFLHFSIRYCKREEKCDELAMRLRENARKVPSTA